MHCFAQTHITVKLLCDRDTKYHLRSKCFFSYIRRAASYIAFGSDIRLSPGDIRFASFSANIISLRRRRNITYSAGKTFPPSGVRHII